MTGDSEAQFVGEVLTDVLPSDLFDVSVVARNATGLTNPEFFNWEINAQQEIAARHPDAVVMVIGGNDGFNVLYNGQLYGPDTPAVAARVRAPNRRRDARAGLERPAARLLGAAADGARLGVQRDLRDRRTRRSSRPPRLCPACRYVDIYNTINHGRYSDTLKIDGRRVLARQADGVHFSRAGAVVPARLILRAMAKDYRVLRGDADASAA